LTANVTPSEAQAARLVVLEHAAEAGRTIDPEHFGISMPFARQPLVADRTAALRARRPDGDTHDIVPAGESELVDLVERHIAAGLSKFVLRPLDADLPAADQLAWLAEIVLPRQT
jgi:hypothetical protein